jgi:hypothetical protein
MGLVFGTVGKLLHKLDLMEVILLVLDLKL